MQDVDDDFISIIGPILGEAAEVIHFINSFQYRVINNNVLL